MENGFKQFNRYLKRRRRKLMDVEIAKQNEEINRLLENITLPEMRRRESADVILGIYAERHTVRPAQPSPSLRFLDDVCDQLLSLMPLKYRERAYEPAKCDAEASRLERFEKDGNEVAANREYDREMRKVVFFTFLNVPMFLFGEILARVRRMVAR